MQRLKSWALENRPTIKRVVQQALGSVTGLEVSLRRYVPFDHKRFDALRAALGETSWSQCIELEYGVYDPAAGELHVLHDAGLYSCLSVSLWSLTDLIAEGHVPRRINFARTLSAYKDDPSADVYPALFSTAVDASAVARILGLERTGFRRFDPHGEYKHISIASLSTLVDCYFRPNDQLKVRTDDIRRTCLQPNQRYLGVWYRGTDKGTEVPPTDSSVYLELAERTLNDGRADRVLIQTDQEQVGALFQKYFKGSCDVIDLLPRTRGQVAIHKGDELEGSRLDYARNMISAVTLMAEMAQVILYTGNIGAWVPLLRGSCRGVWQATKNGIDPQWTDAS